MLKDALQRQLATDPAQSFIVQAPAGSGKTEILTQRLLRLLGRVEAPEQIVALTFTRKAAAEMRERVIQSLQKASQQTEALSAHQQQTLDFARAALERSKQLGWQLLDQPNRLRIMTIDSLCQSLAQSIPVLENPLAFAEVSEQSSCFFQDAARECLKTAMREKPYQAAMKELLLHLDNRQDELIQLFSNLLANRDQWLALIYHARSLDRSRLERGLAEIEANELNRLRLSLPESLGQQLCDLAREVALIENQPDSPRAPLQAWTNFKTLDLNQAKGLYTLVFTASKTPTIRKGFDQHVGLKKAATDESNFQRLKKASEKFLLELEHQAAFIEALEDINSVPKPEYNDKQWQILEALFTLLPLLIAHLQLIFQENNRLDFTAVSQHALQALGSDDEPTDLALYLDHSIHHLLIDEFQDTSLNQFRLLSDLIQGWSPDEGKTLFIVGDPMQSIYRFRQAEVGLFLKVQKEGLGPVLLQCLQLESNFRSDELLVEWVNQRFKTIFPQFSDMASGAVPYHQAVPVRGTQPESSVQALVYQSRQEQAEALVELVRSELARDHEQRLAILVRSRSQLKELIKLLRENNLPYQGVDITLLTHLPHIQDVWTFTQALLQPANRLALLAWLRSPMIGLSLADLHRLAQASLKQSLLKALSNEAVLELLSPEGQARARFAWQLMDKALRNRQQSSLSAWLRETLSLCQPDSLYSAAAQTDLEQYWNLVDQYEVEGQISDFKQFEEALAALYSQQSEPARLQIMTIHKSKGLEFDTVIIPSIGSQSKHADKQLFRWLTLPVQQEEELLLISPLKSSQEEKSEIYNYLSLIDKQKSNYETQRLFYVAVTRAKKRLYLLDHAKSGAKGSFRALLPETDFDSITESQDREDETRPPLLPIWTHPISFYEQQPNQDSRAYQQAKLLANDNQQRLFGILCHQVLQWQAEHQPEDLALPWFLIDYELKVAGLNEEQKCHFKARLESQWSLLKNCPIGQWILSPKAEAHNEWAFLIEDQGQVVTRIIDRCFVDQGIRWIIDYKTGAETPEKKTLYRQQVTQYAEALSKIYPEPIHCGLYYLEGNLWDSWVYTQSTSKQ